MRLHQSNQKFYFGLKMKWSFATRLVDTWLMQIGENDCFFSRISSLPFGCSVCFFVRFLFGTTAYELTYNWKSCGFFSYLYCCPHSWMSSELDTLLWYFYESVVRMRKLQQAARKLRHGVQFVISGGRTRIEDNSKKNKIYGQQNVRSKKNNKNQNTREFKPHTSQLQALCTKVST